jgi:hypothetical protein
MISQKIREKMLNVIDHIVTDIPEKLEVELQNKLHDISLFLENIETDKKFVEWPPFECNQKCPQETKNGYKLSPKSYIGIPPGTKLCVYINKDPNDPNSDCDCVDVVVTASEPRHAVLVDRMSVRMLGLEQPV